MDIKKVLYPTDFSKAGAQALSHARTLASKHGAEVVYMHVRTPHLGDTDRRETEAIRELGLAESELQVVRGVSPPDEILNFAERHAVDIIVMGTHGHSAIGRFLLGSVSERVVRHAGCPVLTVRPERPKYRSRPEYRKILVAYDFSDFAGEALKKAYELGRTYKAAVHVLHVIDNPIHPAYYRMWKEAVDPKEVKPYLHGATAEDLGEETPDIHLHVMAGNADSRPHNEIAAFAEKENADLIVVGTHGLSGLEHIILGSTTERLIRSAPCPVLTIHMAAKARS